MSTHRRPKDDDQQRQQRAMQGHGCNDEDNEGSRLGPDADDEDGPNAVQYFEIGEGVGNGDRDSSKRAGSRGPRESVSSIASPVPPSPSARLQLQQQSQMTLLPPGAAHPLLSPNETVQMGQLHYHIIPSPGQAFSQGCPSEAASLIIPAHAAHLVAQQQYQHQQEQLFRQRKQTERSGREDHGYAPLLQIRQHQYHHEKSKSPSLPELGPASQDSLDGTIKAKCQCHALQQQQHIQSPLRMKRDSDEDASRAGHNREPPALPPRPPPRPSTRRYELPSTSSAIQRHAGGEAGGGVGGGSGSGGGFGANCCKKYVVLCCLCGGLSAAVGCLFLAVHAVLSAHTASLALFETVPSYIPGTMLIFMGLFTMLLARRKHRYGFLMKVCGSISVVCALVCVLVTVTTTVVHMSRLQGLRECVYTARAKSCTCYGAPQSRASDPGVLFEGTPHCEAVHGALYACLRALFGVSVAGILACIFSCMLVYQLLSHEKKKMYWEQLELRCRSLYGQGGPGAALVAAAAAAAAGPRLGGHNGLAAHASSTAGCSCCGDCSASISAASVAGPWWAHSPGNLYTPNPDQLAPPRRWRLPWSRSRGPAPSAEPSYGFQHAQAALTQHPHLQQPQHQHQQQQQSLQSQHHHHHQHQLQPRQQLDLPTGAGLMLDASSPGLVPYGILGPHPQTTAAGTYSLLQAHHRDELAQYHHHHHHHHQSAGPYGVIEAALPLWGPPPPYSDPNSPARRPSPATAAAVLAAAGFPSSGPESCSRPRRVTKRIEPTNYPLREVNFSQASEIKRLNDNYENTEQVSIDTDTDPSENTKCRTTRENKHRKLLRGVENAAFQPHEANAISKQPESEIYFGDVSSCCGPESSLYEVATDKGGKSELSHSMQAGTSSFLPLTHSAKRFLSKRSRRHHHQHQQQQKHQHQQQREEAEMIELRSSSSSSGPDDSLGSSSSSSNNSKSSSKDSASSTGSGAPAAGLSRGTPPSARAERDCESTRHGRFYERESPAKQQQKSKESQLGIVSPDEAHPSSCLEEDVSPVNV